MINMQAFITFIADLRVVDPGNLAVVICIVQKLPQK